MTPDVMRAKLFELMIHLLLLFTAVPVHECAHALVADKLGDPTPRNQGRITLNPFAHLTLWGSLMLLFAGFGWGKPVSVNPNKFKHPKRDMALTALAGPVSNLIMAYLSMVVFRISMGGILYTGSDTIGYLAVVFYYATLINVSLAVFNFLPMPPLDGAKIFGAAIPDKWYFKVMQYEKYIVIVVIILLYSGLLDVPMSFLNEKIYGVMYFLTDWVGLLIK